MGGWAKTSYVANQAFLLIFNEKYHNNFIASKCFIKASSVIDALWKMNQNIMINYLKI
jgi:hypothetical protein